MTLNSTPLPILKVFVASTIMFCNAFMATVLLPYVTFMIADFKLSPEENDIARYSGYLVGSFMFGQLVLSYMLGLLSDKVGRKWVLLLGMIGTGISFLFFGFSTTFTMALVTRTINGSVNGIVGVCKTYLRWRYKFDKHSEITNESNQSKGFAIFGVVRGIGSIFGPIIGGYLSMPSKKYPTIFPPGSFFDRYPYALPSVVGFMIAISGFWVGYFTVDESNMNISSCQPSTTNSTEIENEPESTADESTSLLTPNVDDSVTISNSNENLYMNVHTYSSLPIPTFQLQQKTRLSIIDLVLQKRVFLSLFLYGMVCFIYIQYDELFAIWSQLPPEQGGLGFTSSDQGTAYLLSGICLVLYQLFFFAPIERRLGCLKAFQSGILLSLPAFFILPFTGTFSRWTNNPKLLVWGIVAVSNVLRTIGEIQSLTITFIMVSNSITSQYRGSINGVAQTIGSIGRMVGPIFGGVLLSWSLGNNFMFPFDYHFSFFVLGLMVILTFLLSLWMPVDIDCRLPEQIDD